MGIINLASSQNVEQNSIHNEEKSAGEEKRGREEEVEHEEGKERKEQCKGMRFY